MGARSRARRAHGHAGWQRRLGAPAGGGARTLRRAFAGKAGARARRLAEALGCAGWSRRAGAPAGAGVTGAPAGAGVTGARCWRGLGWRAPISGQ
ncbi:hypothetical protein AXF42_Ash015092 [Apostasia shenzhenica]|uniref:Uncharacterized protein n=1 Tax=Apostasia shenzhenica TaxID=1088818 RepID=A0A2I0B332_9ASPA|nr:hypothetical protein AXF42_Ash015092 [Apostasia shenzhenica]